MDDDFGSVAHPPKELERRDAILLSTRRQLNAEPFATPATPLTHVLALFGC